MVQIRLTDSPEKAGEAGIELWTIKYEFARLNTLLQVQG